MISEYTAKRYCKDDISKIENYEQAINDKTQTWDCHHRLELTINDEQAHTKEELVRLEMYYDRPYFELIFLKPKEHQALHNKSKKHTNSWRMKLIERMKTNNPAKGRPSHRIGKTYSLFGQKFKEHYGFTKIKDPKLYDSERIYFNYHGVCRWEKPNEG